MKVSVHEMQPNDPIPGTYNEGKDFKSIRGGSTIIITGEKGIGKTTLLRKVIERSKRRFCGIISERFERGYYVEDLKTKEKIMLCSEDPIGFKFRRFYFDPEALLFIKKSLKRKRMGDILVYDEIGYLEVEKKIRIWDDIKEPAVLIVRKDLVDVISSEFDGEVFEVKEKNREQLEKVILERIRKW